MPDDLAAGRAEGGASWFHTRGGRYGPTRKALEDALAAPGVVLTGSRPIVAELARSAADLVDSARKEQQPRMWLSGANRLIAMVERLGLGGNGAGGTDPALAGLLASMGAGPEVGDSEGPV